MQVDVESSDSADEEKQTDEGCDRIGLSEQFIETLYQKFDES